MAFNWYARKTMFITSSLEKMIAVQAQNCGALHVYVQGNLEEHKTFMRFVNHPSMADVKNKSIFLHVCVPGQEDNAADYIGDFPTLDQIAEDLVQVLDKLDVKSCIVFGEGAGANILCRFAVSSSGRKDM
ncbi:Ndr family protein [Necator americanus]|uniref:Ndr family protein n=1 Tax=Necator americanus TaxID=51031 RepID=W2SW77_NECAM|nr:Ndr family protein [Necator americanus]ETN73875.1 Ndr family protein [Necator americanus]